MGNFLKPPFAGPIYTVFKIEEPTPATQATCFTVLPPL